MATDSTSKFLGPCTAILLLSCVGCSGGDDGAAQGSNGPSALNATVAPIAPPNDPITSIAAQQQQEPTAHQTLAFLLLGQSNCVGHATVSYSPFPAAVTDSWFIRRDDGKRMPLVDPVGASAKNQAGISFVPRFAQALRDGGETRPLLILPTGVDSTNSVDWLLAIDRADAGGTLIGTARTRVAQALADPDVLIGGIITYQGESDALDPALAPLHAAHWNRIYDDLESRVPPDRWAGPVHIWHVQLASPYPQPGFVESLWQEVQAQQEALSSRPATHVVHQTPVNRSGLHLQTISDDMGLRWLGIRLAADWLTSR